MKLTSVVLCLLVTVALGDYAPLDWDPSDYYDYAGNFESKEIDFNNIELGKVLDYQIEDNRSDAKTKPADDETPLEADGEPIPDDGDESDDAKSDEQKDSNEGIGAVPVEVEEPQPDDGSEETNGEDEDAIDDDSWGDVVEQEIESLSVPKSDDVNKILEETRDILDDDADNTFDDQPVEEVKNEESKESQDEIKELIDEINDMLDDANKDSEEQDGKSDEDVFSEDKEEDDDGEDTADKAYEDLNDDLEKLFETFDKLVDNDSELKESNEEVKVDNVKDYEEKYGWPYKEASVLGERDFEYENIDDSNLSDIFQEAANDAANEDTDSVDNDENRNSEENTMSSENKRISASIAKIAEELNTFEEVDKIASTTGKADIEPIVEPINAEIVDGEKKTEEESDRFDDNLYDDAAEEKEEDAILNSIFAEKLPYGEDGLVDETQPKEEEAEEIEPMDYENGDDAFDNIERMKDIVNTYESTPKSISVSELNSAQLDDLMVQFEAAHQEDLDVSSDDFDKNIAPVHITLSNDETVVISSPSYPEPYPTNNIIDWIFEVDGSGIELNVTDLAVNGALGDYLLIKPGGLDESGTEGIVLSYHLNAERKYRFIDVNKMFVRFEAKAGPSMASSKGFQLGVKRMFAPSVEPVPVPEPEPVIQPPRHTLTLNLAGLTLIQFREIQDDFTNFIASMASLYISESGIYYGFNSTLEVTQITRTAVCSIHWPNYETCVEVTFGVPLNYGEEELGPRLNTEDLEDMWNTMISRSDFAAQLNAMGIKEYMIPNDRTVLTVWLVIAAGVVLSVAMLAFALWRFSCFEDYTRMRAFSDTDSIRNEKRNLDLYPTPHQTLPPLYSENEYKWADEKYDDSTRVDMGGFANKSYVRDELYQFDSDEDVVAPRDREGTISTKDIYAV